MPKVSVVMCVFNGCDFVSDAIDSILSQSFMDFEFIICDDGSTDDTPKILKDYAKIDKRVKIITKGNSGLTKSLNWAITFAGGEYIARQDADDISLSNRLKEQVQYLDANENISLLGTNTIESKLGKKRVGTHYDIEAINKIVFLQNPFSHTSVMFRAKEFRDIGGYDPSFDTSQDFELWMRFAKNGKIAMLEEPMVILRQDYSLVSQKFRHRQFINATRARLLHRNHNFLIVLKATLYQIISGVMPNFVIRIKRYFFK